MVADITTSTSEGMDEVIFTADTPKGEQFLGERERRVPVSEAAALRTAALDAGLTVEPFP
jgi:hypothetical protein